MTPLKPCPFCGIEPDFMAHVDDSTLDLAKCVKPDCAMNDAGWVYVAAWNTRPADQERVEAARQAMMMLIRNEDAGLERIEGLAIRLGVDLYNSSK